MLDFIEDELYETTCPACGSPLSFCQGHGEIGDPDGRAILDAHDDGYHGDCDPAGCEDALPLD